MSVGAPGGGATFAGLEMPSINPPLAAFMGGSDKPKTDEKTGNDANKGEQATEQPFIGNALAGYISAAWARNKRVRDLLEYRFLACLRARRGVYAALETSEMWTAGAGESIYLPVAASKMRAAEAALRELLLPEGERPWGVDPSPIPDLPPEIEGPILQRAKMMAQQQMMQMAKGQGKVVRLNANAEITAKLQAQIRDQVLEALRQEAKTRAGRMEDQIEERMERGGYYKAIAEFIQHFCTYPGAVLKGPFLKSGKRMKWGNNPQQPDVINEPELTWFAVNPFDAYPAPEAESCQDGDFIERIRLSRADLFSYIGVPGYNEQAIRNVLASHTSGALRAWLWNDAERRMLENFTHDVWIPEHLIDALHFWGSVEGKALIEYGIKGISDPLAYYEVDAVMIGQDVIRCEINDDPLGRRPYFNASYDPVPGAFWGNSIYELMRDCQAMINACARALNANMGLASGPIMGIDMSQLAAGQDPKAMRPLQILQLDRSRAQAAASPIEWYQADSRATELLGIIEKFEAKADDLTGIPRYMNGVQDATGAAATASGLSMLMGTAAKGLRRAVANIDRQVIAQTVQAAYIHEMLYNPDESIKGDCTIDARGAAAVLIKEHLQQTRTQFLAQTINPVDMDIIGKKGRRAILKEVASSLEMDQEEIFGTDQEFDQREQQRVAIPPQPTPDATLKAQTELTKKHIDRQTKLEVEGIIHPRGAAAVASAETAEQAANSPGGQPNAPQIQQAS